MDGFCYTVHSSKDPRQECYEAAILLLDFNAKTSLIEAKVVYHNADECDVHFLVEKLLDRFDATRFTFKFTVIFFKSPRLFY